MAIKVIDVRDYADPVWHNANVEHWRKILAELRTAAFERGIVFVDQRELCDPDDEVSRTDPRWQNIADAIAIARRKDTCPQAADWKIRRWLESAQEDGYPGALLNAALNALIMLHIAPVNHGVDHGDIQHFPDAAETVEVIDMEQLAGMTTTMEIGGCNT